MAVNKADVKLVYTSPTAFNAITLKDVNTIYFVDNPSGDTKLYLGSDLIFENTYVKKESPLGRTITTSTDLGVSDISKIVSCTNTGAINVIIPNSTALPVGTEIYISRLGSGEVTVLPASGVTIRAAGGKLRINNRYDMVSIIKISTTEWQLVGALKV